MREKIRKDLNEKLISHFKLNDKKYSIYSLKNRYNLVDEEMENVRKRLKHFDELEDIFIYLDI